MVESSRSGSSSSSNQKWIVSVVDEAFSSSTTKGAVGGFCRTNQSHQLVKIPDPATKEDRQYLLVDTTAAIFEIQDMVDDFSSFFVGRHIVKDGSLYVMNRIDPLFFVLASYSSDENVKQSWQPFDQCKESWTSLSSLPHINNIFKEDNSDQQLRHLFQGLCSEQTDNVTFYKFNVSKALQWLHKKQESVYQVLVKQDQIHQKKQKLNFNAMTASKGGSVSSSFNMPEQQVLQSSAKTTTTTTTDESSIHSSNNNTKQLKIESIQIVCNYLSDEWKQTFIKSFDNDGNDVLTEAIVLETNTTTNSSTNTSASSSNPYQKSDDGGGSTGSTATPSSSSSNNVSNNKKRPQQHIDAGVVNKTTNAVTSNKKLKEILQPKTAANKRLMKVSTKGMKSINSFFSASKKKK